MVNISWIVVNGVMAFLMYVGFIEGNENAASVVVIFAWFIGITAAVPLMSSTLMADTLKTYMKMKTKKQKPSVKSIRLFATIDGIYDVFVIVTFMNFGFIMTGLVYAINMLMIQKVISHWARLRKIEIKLESLNIEVINNGK